MMVLMIHFEAQPQACVFLAAWREMLKQACQETLCLLFFLKCLCHLSFVPLTEQLLEFMHQLPAFANMTMSVRRELCAVMVFAVVERAGTIVLNDGEEVRAAA